MDTAAPDSAGGFPSRAVRSVPLLPVRHSATISGARFLSSFERATLSRDVARIRRILAACRTSSGNVVRTRRVLTASGKSEISRNDETAPPFRTTFECRRRRGEHRITLPTAGVVNVAETVFANRAGAVSPPYSAPSGRFVNEGGLALSPQRLRVRPAGRPSCCRPQAFEASIHCSFGAGHTEPSYGTIGSRIRDRQCQKTTGARSLTWRVTRSPVSTASSRPWTTTWTGSTSASGSTT